MYKKREKSRTLLMRCRKSESDSESNDEIEFDIDNDEYDEKFVKSILIIIKAYIF